MNRHASSFALAAIASLLAGAEAFAQPVAPVAPVRIDLPLPDRVEYERGFEWGGYEAYTKLTLERQPDGSYLAEIGGKDHTARVGVKVSALQLLSLRERLQDMQSFPTDSFAGAGNHGYTSLEATGTDAAGQPWALKRWFYETSVAELDRRAAALEQAVVALIEARVAELERPRLDRFRYERGIEWGGHHAKVRLSLTRQPDGTYLADVGGEDHTARSGVVVSEAQLEQLRRTLHELRDFPDDSFAGDGNHWYTRLQAEGERPDGATWSFARSCYDPNHPRGRAAIDGLEDVIGRLIATFPPFLPPAASGGLVGNLPQ